MNLWIVVCAKVEKKEHYPSFYQVTESWFTDSAEDAEEFAHRLIRDGRQYVTIHTANPISDYGQRVRIVLDKEG